MSKKKLVTRRQQRRDQSRFPAGMYVALLTGAVITLVGVFLRLEPNVILYRAAISAVTIGGITAFGLSVVRLTATDSENSEGSRR